MKKNRILCTLLLCLLMITAAACSGSKKDEQLLDMRTNLVTVNQTQDFTLIVAYDKSSPEIHVISPSGQRYADESSFVNVLHDTEAGYDYYGISQAKKGTWIIEYSFGDNNSVQFGTSMGTSDYRIVAPSNADPSASAEEPVTEPVTMPETELSTEETEE